MLKKMIFRLVLIALIIGIVEFIPRLGFSIMGTSYEEIRDSYSDYRTIRLGEAKGFNVQTHPYLPYVNKPNPRHPLGMQIIVNDLSLEESELFTIVTVGGSTTASLYPRFLYFYLKENYPEQNFRVVNAGIPAWTTAESLINLALRALEYHPDLIVVYHAYNDVFPSCVENFKADYSHWRKQLDVELEPNLFDTFPQIFDQSAFYVGLRRLITDPKKPPANTFAASTIQQAYRETCDFNGRDTFRRNIVSMIGIAQVHQSDVLLVSQSVHVYDDRLDYIRHVEEAEAHNAILEAVATEYDTYYLDFYNVWQPELRAEYHTDLIHLTDDGYEILAQSIGDKILSEYLDLD